MIEQLLQEINEDKHTNPATTSNKFKTDLWNFVMQEYMWPQDKTAVEFGTHKGQTTRILSHLFGKVHTFNLPGNFDKAMQLNSDRNNINYIGLDLYKTDVYDTPVNDSISFYLVDAGHSTDQVLTDFSRLSIMNNTNPCYIVFDDYGLIYDVHDAVNYLLEYPVIEVVAEIGHPKGYDFKNGRVLNLGPEGLICKLINN